MSRLISNYEGIEGEELNARPGFRCSRCRGAKCRRHGGPPKPKSVDEKRHGIRIEQAQLQDDLEVRRALHMGEYLKRQKGGRKWKSWKDEHGRHGYVGDPVIAL